jgi:hypothetical protein
LAGQKGYDWQAEKVSELADVFGEENVIVGPDLEKNRPQPLPHEKWLDSLQGYCFVVEGSYEVDTKIFRQAVGIKEDLCDRQGELMSLSKARPDVIQTFPPLSTLGNPQDESRVEYREEVCPNGQVKLLDEDDDRVRLRVIDIKQTAEPGSHYFAEVVYYSMTLAAFLEAEDLSDEYVVVAAPAVWPGSHEASHLAEMRETWRKRAHTAIPAELSSALEEDIEVAPVDAYAPRLCRLLSKKLPDILDAKWDELDWHVDHRCRGCDFLGYPWENKEGEVQNHRLHCWPTAEREGHLSRVAGLTRGGASELKESGKVDSVSRLASTGPFSPVLGGHQGLKMKRTLYPHRADALKQDEASVIPESGGDALMPRWPNLWIYVFLDYDLASAITVNFGLRASWEEPIPYERRNELKPQREKWREEDDSRFSESYIVGEESVEAERKKFLEFLRALKQILNDVRQQDRKDQKADRRNKKTAHSTYQILLWDEAQRKHLARLVSRHLPAILGDKELRSLAWLLPPAGAPRAS